MLVRKCPSVRAAVLSTLFGLCTLACDGDADAAAGATDPVLEWNQVLVDTLVATSTPNAASPRLAAIVHTAIFDAQNGIERRYAPLYVRRRAPLGASSRAAVIAAAHTVLVRLFPARQAMLDASYEASIAVYEGDPGAPLELGIAWGREVAEAVLAWRATDGFDGDRPPFVGGQAPGQWRPTPPKLAAMSAQALAFTAPFVLQSAAQLRPEPPRPMTSATYASDVMAVKALGCREGSTRSEEQTALAFFWEGNASVHWNQAANQLLRANRLPLHESSRLLAVLNIAMADASFTAWSAKRFYGSDEGQVTWRPVTAIALIDEPGWLPLIETPAHPEYPAGHPSLNGAAATILLRRFAGKEQPFTLTTAGQPSRTYASIAAARADGNGARVWGGMHYPSTVARSDALGEAVATYVDQNAMRPDSGTR